MQNSMSSVIHENDKTTGKGSAEAGLRLLQGGKRAGEGRPGSLRGEGQRKMLIFTLSGMRLCIEIGAIKEIIEYRPLTCVPLTPDIISGVMNLRGNVVPVINLARRLGLEPAPIGKRSCILVIEAQEGELSLDLGIVADMVNEVADVGAEDIEPAPDFGTSIPPEFLGGMLRLDGDFTPMLALERVFSVAELMVPATRLDA